MKTEWDYTDLAEAYLSRPDYSEDAVERIIATANLGGGGRCCDVGAGVAHLTLPLAARGLDVVSVEPNDAMRALGRERTAALANVTWFEGTGERTGQADDAFDLVTFGSSFNVTDRPVALRETRRILKSRGWFACLWNHRDLDDPFQKSIEDAIKAHVDGYDYGTRREDQTAVIVESGLFETPIFFESAFAVAVAAADWVEAWRSHATLARQSGEKREAIIADIQRLVDAAGGDVLSIPYVTRVWMARLKD